jgi:hypothetical protein
MNTLTQNSIISGHTHLDSFKGVIIAVLDEYKCPIGDGDGNYIGYESEFSIVVYSNGVIYNAEYYTSNDLIILTDVVVECSIPDYDDLLK